MPQGVMIRRHPSLGGLPDEKPETLRWVFRDLVQTDQKLARVIARGREPDHDPVTARRRGPGPFPTTATPLARVPRAPNPPSPLAPSPPTRPGGRGPPAGAYLDGLISYRPPLCDWIPRVSVKRANLAAKVWWP